MKTDNIIIRKVEKTEVKELQKIGKATFFETFVNDCSPMDMKKYLEEKHSIALLKSELKNPESHFFFVVANREIVGYLKLNQGKAQTELILENALEIEKLYVLVKFQGKKVGQLLMDKALEIATSKQFNQVWLGVWEHNSKAIHFYEKNGFVVFGNHPFILGNEEQTDVLMKLEVLNTF